MPMRRLSDLLQVKPAAVTGTVDRLVRAGLAVREVHPSDRRSTLVSLTPAARRLVGEIFVVLRELQGSN
jgi:DNA-binding MarR family transcriptional regulator